MMKAFLPQHSPPHRCKRFIDASERCQLSLRSSLSHSFFVLLAPCPFPRNWKERKKNICHTFSYWEQNWLVFFFFSFAYHFANSFLNVSHGFCQHFAVTLRGPCKFTSLAETVPRSGHLLPDCVTLVFLQRVQVVGTWRQIATGEFVRTHTPFLGVFFLLNGSVCLGNAVVDLPLTGHCSLPRVHNHLSMEAEQGCRPELAIYLGHFLRCLAPVTEDP